MQNSDIYFYDSILLSGAYSLILRKKISSNRIIINFANANGICNNDIKFTIFLYFYYIKKKKKLNDKFETKHPKKNYNNNKYYF